MTRCLLLLVILLALPRDAVAQQAFDVEAATDAYLAQLTPEERERSDAYFEGGYWLLLWVPLYTGAAMWLMLRLGWSAGMRALAERLTTRTPLRIAAYAAQFVVLTSLLLFPLTWYTGFFREHQYDLATQSFGPWLIEQMLGLAVGLVVTVPLLAVLYRVFRAAPRTWWLWGTGVGVAFLFFGMLLAPVFVFPIFNAYEPVERPEVRDPILSMARANGVPANDVYVFDASRQSTRISANVSGILGTTRLSLNDNLLNRTSVPEIEAVMGHELGHYVLHHSWEALLFNGLVLLGGFAFVRFAYDRVLERWGARWNVRGIGDPAGLPLLLLLYTAYSFALTPVANTFIRTNEAEADVFGLNVAREPDAWAQVVVRLSEYRKLDPTPLEELLLYDHPSGRSRIEMGMRWKAEHLDEIH
jgi:STE24 endopeptidase